MKTQEHIEGGNLAPKNVLNSYIVYDDFSNKRYFESLDGTITGNCKSNEDRVVLSRRALDPWNINGTKELFGLMNCDDYSMILPFIFDGINIGQGDIWEYDQELGYAEVSNRFSFAIVYQENAAGKTLSGLFIDNKLVIPLTDCTIKQIEIRRDDGEYEVLDYFWVSEATGKTYLFAPYGETVFCDSYSFEKSFLLWKGGLAAIFSCGHLISDFKYSNAESASDGYYYVFSGDRIGLLHREKGEVMPPQYLALRRNGFEKEYVVADDKLYSITGDLLFDPDVWPLNITVKYIFDELSFKAIVGNKIFNDSGQLCFDAGKHGFSFQSYDYENMIFAFKQCNGEYVFFDNEFEELKNGEDYDVEEGEIHFANNRVFMINDESFHDEKDNDSNDNMYYEDPNYEEDTYYALGGDDYDKWKDNGGNIDDMMDGMGF